MNNVLLYRLSLLGAGTPPTFHESLKAVENTLLENNPPGVPRIDLVSVPTSRRGIVSVLNAPDEFAVGLTPIRTWKQTPDLELVEIEPGD